MSSYSISHTLEGKEASRRTDCFSRISLSGRCVVPKDLSFEAWQTGSNVAADAIIKPSNFWQVLKSTQKGDIVTDFDLMSTLFWKILIDYLVAGNAALYNCVTA